MIGFGAGYNLTSPGCSNTIVGACSLDAATGASPNTTSENTAIGFNVLGNFINGNNNTAIGAFAGCDLTCGNYNIFLGHQASVGGDSSNKIRIGGGPTTYCAFVYAPSWNFSSDVRHKAIDPAGVPYGMDLINKIEPIAFQMCNPETQEIPHDTHYYGFSAQQVAEVEEELGINVFVDKDSNPDCWSLETNSFLPVMMNALKELQAEIKSLKEEIKTLKG
jgi:hypothetical protein